ncbi:MAG TPA: DUF3187 family protein, partial [Steroidobacteraceae bacterium]|nr:DUF3187 family protein [Steroidobacteraceae bacterium]
MLISTEATADPFPARDLNPLLSGFGLPSALPARIADDSWSFAADFNWASTALAQRAGSERLIVDAEIREMRLTLGRSWSNGFAARLETPYRYTGGGVLDAAIDSWHDAFGLPEGARAAMPRDRIRIAYARGNNVLLDMQAPQAGIGDVSLDVGRSLGSSTRGNAAAWLSVKLPSGDADRFTGSGAPDVSLALAGDRRLGENWSVFGQAGVTRLGDGERFPKLQEDIVWSGLAGIGWRAWGGLELKAQIDVHTAVFDEADVDFLGDAIVLTVGGDYRFVSGWQLDVAVSEDIAVESA